MNFSLTNARSLPPKIHSLITAFDELDLDFMMITETWISSTKKTVQNIHDLSCAENISLICKNRNTRGGGVCIAFDKRKMKIARFPLPTSPFEVVCGVGSLSRLSRKIAIIVVYIPPKYTNEEVRKLNDYVSLAIEKLKNTYNNPLICVGGDINKKDFAPAIADFNDIAMLPGIPSRRGNALDLCFSNFGQDIFQISSHPPLNGPSAESDHLILNYNYRAKKKHDFTTVVRKFRPITEAGTQAFVQELARQEWGDMVGKNSSDMVEVFDERVGVIFRDCFPERTVKSRSTDKPWVTKRIKRILRRKKRAYRRDGKGMSWSRVEAEARAEIATNRCRYLDKVKKRAFDEKNSKCYHRAVKLLQDADCGEKWSPSSLFPEKSDLEVAEECSSFFNKISNEFRQITQPAPPEVLLDPPEVFQIAGRLRAFRKPSSLVPGDLPPALVTKCSDVLAIPLSIIFSEVYKTCAWPSKWKTETVTVIPKNSAPASLSETRNISCTPLYSKLLESFILEELRRSVTLNDTQFGGIKGLGVDHFLVETWNEILACLDKKDRAVNLMSIDFQKAFNRMDHSVCLRKLRDKGAPEHLVQLVGAFLFERSMTVKIGDARSIPKLVNGGAPQGSVLGPFLFCVVSEYLSEAVEGAVYDEEVPEIPALLPADSTSDDESSPDSSSSSADWAEVEREFNFFRMRKPNPLNDTVLSDINYEVATDDQLSKPTVKAYIDDFNIIEELNPNSGTTRHITAAKTKRKIRAPKSQKIFGDITTRSKDIGMVVNEKKTQLLCISSNPNYESTSFIRSDSAEITAEKQLKILGFVFGQRPSCRDQVEYLRSKFRDRLWSMRKLKRGGMTQPDLVKFYTCCLRPIIEYTGNTLHSMLTQEQSGWFEQAQALALRIVYGTESSYRNSLENCGLDRLSDRRRRNFEKFTVKASKNARIKDRWFPLNHEILHDTRARKIYLEEHASTDKLYNSPMFTMRRYLNTLQ